MEKSIVNEEIYALIYSKNGTKIILDNDLLITNEIPTMIIEKMCLFYGSSLKGRIMGTRNILGIGYKCPIIISENKSIIAIPSSSYKEKTCNWIMLNGVLKYYYIQPKKLRIILKNGQEIDLDMSLGSFDRQILRASRLLAVLNARK